MNQEDRLKEIKSLLKEKHEISTKYLAKHFHVSFDTARRDVVRLTSTGQALRVHGGLMENDRNSVPNFLTREQILSPIKEKMARVAKRFVHPGQFDYVAPSTTLRLLCTMISGIDLEIITNSIDAALVLAATPLPSVQLLGGTINKTERLTYSSETLLTLKKLRFDTVFIGCAKVRDDGIYTTSKQDADFISVITSRAKQVILIAEKYKFTTQHSAPFMSAPLDRIDVMITDTPPEKKIYQNFDSHTRIISVTKKVNYD